MPTLAYRRMDRIRKRDGDTCCYCGKHVHRVQLSSHAQSDRPSIEHVVDRKYGGGNQLDNLKLAHAGCNSAVGQWTYQQKIARMGAHGHQSYATQLVPEWMILGHQPKPKKARSERVRLLQECHIDPNWWVAGD